MTQQPRVILDDHTGDITYSGTTWLVNDQQFWYLGATTYPPSTGNGVFGSFTLSFEGTSIAFIGNTPPTSSAQFATYSIDGGTPYNSNYDSPPGQQSYVQWYQSPLLSDGNHTITVSHVDGTAVDMAIITVGSHSPLTNRIIFVDNNDPAIQYTGSWTESNNWFIPGNLPAGLPIGNTTQRTTTPGDTMTFQFTGTAVSIYGIFSWANIGIISATYSLDGVVQTLSYPIRAGSPQYLGADGDASNFLFFNNNTLPAGDHTLVMTITDVQNTMFIFDYITYAPSFTSLATMPNLTSGSTTSTRPASGSSNINTNTNTFAKPDSTSIQPSPVASQGNGKGVLIGAIVGGSVGGVLIMLLIITILYLLKRGSIQFRPQFESEFDPLVLYTNNNTSSQIRLSSFRRTGRYSRHMSTNITPFLVTAIPNSDPSVPDRKRDMTVGQDHSPFSITSEASTSTVPLLDGGQRPTLVITHTEHTASTNALERLPDSVPPAYEALSPH